MPKYIKVLTKEEENKIIRSKEYNLWLIRRAKYSDPILFFILSGILISLTMIALGFEFAWFMAAGFIALEWFHLWLSNEWMRESCIELWGFDNGK